MNTEQEISNRQSHHPLSIIISHKLNSYTLLIKSNFAIEAVANDTIESNYNLSKEHDKDVLQINNLHEQIAAHQEMIPMLHTHNKQQIEFLLNHLQREFSNTNLMQRILKFSIIRDSPSSLSNYTMYSLLYNDIARLSSCLNNFFQGAFKNPNIGAYIAAKYGDNNKTSILSIMNSDHLLRQMIANLILRNTKSSCDCVINSNLTSDPIIFQTCKSSRCIIKWINDSIEAVHTLRTLTGHILAQDSYCGWPDWKIVVVKFIELNHFCPFDMPWLDPIQSNTLHNNTPTDNEINAARLCLLTIADKDKDLQNDS